MKAQFLILHHEMGSNGFKGVNAYHKKLWNFRSSLGGYCGYHYYIDKTGKIWQARADTDIGAHCRAGGMNFKSIGICLEGNLEATKPTPAQKDALWAILKRLLIKHAIPISNLKAHKEIGNTACPGKYGMKLLEEFRKPQKECKTQLLAKDKIIETLKSEVEILKTKLDKIRKLIC